MSDVDLFSPFRVVRDAVHANPDLPERLRGGAAFNPADRKTYYGGSAKGYTDYPALLERVFLSYFKYLH
jgi:2,4-dienoyl-CoA reductase-like NADH-dependent reductase (Old Yellow Enzyme family)